MNNSALKTIASFGDEWTRFDQSGMGDAEAERYSMSISPYSHGKSCRPVPRDSTWDAAVVAGHGG